MQSDKAKKYNIYIIEEKKQKISLFAKARVAYLQNPRN